MSEFILTISFPAQPPQEFFALIPAHRTRVNELMQQGTITSYSLAADRSMLWITMLTETREEAVEILRSLPLYPYMEFIVRELMFHNTPMFATPRFSVN